MAKADRYGTLPAARSFPKDIQRMACDAHQVPPFTGGEMVVQIQLKSFIIHGGGRLRATAGRSRPPRRNAAG